MLAPNITPETERQDRELGDLAKAIRSSIEAATHAAADFLEYAMAAGDALCLAKSKIAHGGWLKFLRVCELSEDRAEKYMAVARGRGVLDSARERNLSLSLNAALRLLKPAAASPLGKAKNEKPAPALSARAWSEASPEARGLFLRQIGLVSILEALPASWVYVVERRLASSSSPKLH